MVGRWCNSIVATSIPYQNDIYSALCCFLNLSYSQINAETETTKPLPSSPMEFFSYLNDAITTKDSKVLFALKNGQHSILYQHGDVYQSCSLSIMFYLDKNNEFYDEAKEWKGFDTLGTHSLYKPAEEAWILFQFVRMVYDAAMGVSEKIWENVVRYKDTLNMTISAIAKNSNFNQNLENWYNDVRDIINTNINLKVREKLDKIMETVINGVTSIKGKNDGVSNNKKSSTRMWTTLRNSLSRVWARFGNLLSKKSPNLAETLEDIYTSLAETPKDMEKGSTLQTILIKLLRHRTRYSDKESFTIIDTIKQDLCPDWYQDLVKILVPELIYTNMDEYNKLIKAIDKNLTIESPTWPKFHARFMLLAYDEPNEDQKKENIKLLVLFAYARCLRTYTIDNEFLADVYGTILRLTLHAHIDQKNVALGSTKYLSRYEILFFIHMASNYLLCASHSREEKEKEEEEETDSDGVDTYYTRGGGENSKNHGNNGRHVKSSTTPAGARPPSGNDPVFRLTRTDDTITIEII